MYDIIKTVLAVILMASLYTTASAQNTYTLEECHSMALENNARLKNARNDVAGAIQVKKEAFTNYFPNISATGIGYNANKGLIEMDMGPGMSISLLKNGIMGGVTLTQPIFAGGQIVNGNKLSEIGVDVSRLQLAQTENEVRLTVEQFFWQIITVEEKRKTLAQIDTMLVKLHHDVEAAVNAGMTTRNDLLQVQLKQNEIQSAIITLDSNCGILKKMLAQYMGLGTEEINVTYNVPFDEAPEFPNDVFVVPQDALTSTIEYKMLRNNVDANRLQYKIAVGKNLPTVGAGVGYIYDNLTDKDHAFGIAFVSVSIPISGWWGGSHSIKKQRLAVMNSQTTFEDSQNLLVIKMEKAWSDLKDAWQHIGIEQKSIEQATENLRLNRDYYRAGTTTLSDLLDAQSLFQQSRDKYVESYSQFRIKRVEYLQATGR